MQPTQSKSFTRAKRPPITLDDFSLVPWAHAYQADGETVLAAESLLPRCAGESRGTKRFNRLYAHLQRCFLRALERRAGAETRRWAEARANARWFSPGTAALRAQLLPEEGSVRVRWELWTDGERVFAGEERWNLGRLWLLG